ncbi:MAG: transketolase C-terminal domain-containing protein, partial [Oscillospiraceae bacterium]
IHVQTKKGKGYKFAEQNPDLFHGVSKFDIKTGTQNSKESFSDKFGEALTNLAKKDDKICAITAAMTQGTGLVPFYTLFPDRFFDVSIAEQHAVTFAAGLASCGIKPVFAVYSTFLQRGYDQIIHDCAIEKQHVVFAVDRAGIVGEDGETHQGLFDVSYLSSIPGVVIYSPSNFKELEISLKKALYEEKGVVALRYPRGGEISSEIHCESCTFSLTQNDNNNDILIISYGRIISFVYDAVSTLKSENINIDLLKLVKIHPIDNEIIKLCLKYKKIFFVEESIKNGSVGEHLLSSLAENNFSGNFYHNSVDNIFISHQSTFQAINQCGFDTQGIINFVKKGI